MTADSDATATATATATAGAKAQPARMRADALRNREHILRAAREIFAAQGPDAPLDEIARRAGVGVATLYRRFPDRSDLIRGVAVEVFTALGEAALVARDERAEPFEALRTFMHAALDLKLGSVLPALMGRVAMDEVLDGVRQDAADPIQELLTQAQAAGTLRPDVLFGDIALMLMRISRPLPGEPLAEDGDLAHRQLEIYLDGLRTPGATAPRAELPGPAVDIGWFKRIRAHVIGKAPGSPPGPQI
ncbi:TetR/AcrR family transcriptional regulator [Streptomyces zagrosensis]|uniref:AcrR family transcriptional regulator n=1 Tax=Streptomyces zagrosensis TaxID=1042984 RepID=A0A7W9UZ11_9ACTN|nr:helix-turn-helix domain-containing protein [Streptomyces zagrosensis]MBB5935926.1 AcrR family transcriptional regulator [Streptomyces zagrosensis]